MAKTTRGRIITPTNPVALMTLANKVYAKHQDDGASSPLNELEDDDWAVSGPKIAQAQASHDRAEQFKAQMEEAYRDRDALMPEISGIINASKALLKAKYSKNPKRLGDWGFQVDDTPKAKKNGAA